MYPINFENIYYEKIWGGRDLESFRNNLPPGDIGECLGCCMSSKWNRSSC